MLLSQAIELLQRTDFGVQNSNCIWSPKFWLKYFDVKKRYFFLDSGLFLTVWNFYYLIKFHTFPMKQNNWNPCNCWQISSLRLTSSALGSNRWLIFIKKFKIKKRVSFGHGSRDRETRARGGQGTPLGTGSRGETPRDEPIRAPSIMFPRCAMRSALCRIIV